MYPKSGNMVERHLWTKTHMWTGPSWGVICGHKMRSKSLLLISWILWNFIFQRHEASFSTLITVDFCPQMTLHDIPGLWIFVHNSQIGVKSFFGMKRSRNDICILRITESNIRHVSDGLIYDYRGFWDDIFPDNDLLSSSILEKASKILKSIQHVPYDLLTLQRLTKI